MTTLDPAVKDQIIGMARIIVPAVAAFGVARGWFTTQDAGAVTQDMVDGIVAVVTVGAIVWSFLSHRQTSQIARVAAMPMVKRVVAESSIADGTLKNDPKVVSS